MKFNKLDSYKSIKSAILGQDDDSPLYLFKPQTLSQRIKIFQNNFLGRTLYAVKANHNPYVIEFLSKHGIDAFDVASIDEVSLVYKLCPEAEIFFMNPIKSPSSIKLAYHHFGVRNFALDSEWELDKILKETSFPEDLSLFLRIAVCNKKSSLDLSNKFGATIEEAPELLNKMAAYAKNIGLAFHVGSQCSDPNAHHDAFNQIRDILGSTTVGISTIDIGGGFSANYSEDINDPLTNYLESIRNDCQSFINSGFQLLSEPGRAMVADCCSLVLKVIGRKENVIYLTDGMYGGLFENTADDIQFPIKPFSFDTEKSWSRKNLSFKVRGPTCDRHDVLEGVEFMLPENLSIGDYIEFDYAGAYSEVFKNNFSGFHRFNQACLDFNSV